MIARSVLLQRPQSPPAPQAAATSLEVEAPRATISDTVWLVTPTHRHTYISASPACGRHSLRRRRGQVSALRPLSRHPASSSGCEEKVPDRDSLLVESNLTLLAQSNLTGQQRGPREPRAPHTEHSHTLLEHCNPAWQSASTAGVACSAQRPRPGPRTTPFYTVTVGE